MEADDRRVTRTEQFKSWLAYVFQLGDAWESKSQARSRRALAVAALIPATVAVLVVFLDAADGPAESENQAVQALMTANYVNSIWTATDAIGFALLALLGSLMIESYGRACAAAISASVIVGLLVFAVGFVHEFDAAVEDRRTYVSASIILCLLGLAAYDVWVIKRRAKQPGTSRANLTILHPMSITLASCENCSQAVLP